MIIPFNDVRYDFYITMSTIINDSSNF